MSYWTSFGRERRNSLLTAIFITSFLVLFSVSKERMPKWEIIAEKKVNLPILRAYRPRPKNAFCKDVFMIQNYSISSSNEKLDLSLEVISNAKQLSDYMFYAYYGVLSTLLPPLVVEAEPFKGINGSNYTIPQESKLDRMNWKLPFLPCRLREYNGEDVHTCAQKRNQKGKQLRISFIGDSRVRRPMEHLLEILNKFNLTITTERGVTIPTDDFLGEKGNILWPKYKQKLEVRSSLLPNFHISYMWAPFFSRGDSDTDETPFHKKYMDNIILLGQSINNTFDPVRKNDTDRFNETAYISNFKSNKLTKAMRSQMQSGRNNGAFDELKKMLKIPIPELPDFIFIGSSAWQLGDINLGFLRNLDFWCIQGTKKIYKVLKELGTRTTVILLLPSPFKDYLRFEKDKDGSRYFKIQNNNHQQWYLNAQLQLFPKNIRIWDTFLPVAFSSVDDCAAVHSQKVQMELLPKVRRFTSHDSYMCTDRMHIGQEAINTAAQMILNHICNEDMEKHTEQRYCCDILS